MLTSNDVKEAWSAVEEAQLPGEVRAAALREVLRSMFEGAQPAGKARPERRQSASGAGSDGEEGIDIDEQAVYELVARETGTTADKLEQILMIDEGVIKMALPGKDLGKSTADAARTVAQLITVVGAYGLGRRDTEYEVIRKECDRLKVYDSKNFASKHLPSISGFVTKGSGTGRRLEVKALGRDNFAGLVDKLVGES